MSDSGSETSMTPHSANGDRTSRSRSVSAHRSSRSGSRSGKRYRTRSRSRSRRRSKYSRSRSRSSEYYRAKRRRTYDDNPRPNRCLGVFGLSIYTTERQIKDIFQKYGQLESVQVIYDAKTQRSRGFCFVYYERESDAKVAKEECTGMEIDGRRIRVDFSITQRAHTPTPGIYMGHPTYTRDDRRGYGGGRRYYEEDYGDRRGYRGHGGRRSPSPYRRRGGYRSRSRSYSPRRY